MNSIQISTVRAQAYPTMSLLANHNLVTLSPGLLKGTVSPDILIFFMMSIIKSVLFVRPLIPIRFFYSFITFIFVYKVVIYI
jgi:hypothetical protein